MNVGSRRTRRTSRTIDGQPARLLSAAFQAFLSAIPYLAFARVGLGLTLWFALSSTTAEPDPTLELSSQTTFVEADGTMRFDLVIDPGDASDPVLSLVVHGLVESEEDLEGPLPQVLNRLAALPLDSLERTEGGGYRLTVPVRPGAQFDGLDRMKLPAAGVYPVALELRNAEGAIAVTRTNVIRLRAADLDQTAPGSPDGPTVGQAEVAVVLPVSDETGRVEATVALLQAHPTTPLTLLIDSAGLDRIRADEQLRLALGQALGGRPVVAASEPDLDPSALAEIDQEDLFVELTEATRTELRGLGLTPATELLLLDTRPTTDGLFALDAIGVSSVLNVAGLARDSGTLRADGTTVRMVAADTELSDQLDGEGGTHRANRALTLLTLRNQDNAVPVVLAPEAPDLETVDAFLRGLAEGPAEPVLVTDIWNVRAGRTGSGWLRPAERPRQDLRPVADVLWRVQQKLLTYQGFDSGAGQGLSAEQGGEVETIRRGIAEALGIGNSPRSRLETLENLEDQLNDELEVIDLHEGQPVTLAARSAPIPVVLESSADGPRKIMLRLRSDKVDSVDDAKVIEIPPGTTSIDVELEARSLGVSPLEVSVWTPDGRTMLASTQFEVRSTAVPGIGLLATGGAVMLLATWWILDARRRRRERSELATIPVPVDQTEGRRQQQ